jgi:hypothetical protein
VLSSFHHKLFYLFVKIRQAHHPAVELDLSAPGGTTTYPSAYVVLYILAVLDSKLYKSGLFAR